MTNERKIREIRIPNTCWILDFTIYLSDLVYWFGFVTGVTFTAHLWNVDFIDLLTLWGKSAFQPGLFFWEKEPLFELDIFPCFRLNPYTRMCVLTIESLSLFREIVKRHGKLPIISWFCGFSLILDFFVYFDYL